MALQNTKEWKLKNVFGYRPSDTTMADFVKQEPNAAHLLAMVIDRIYYHKFKNSENYADIHKPKPFKARGSREANKTKGVDHE